MATDASAPISIVEQDIGLSPLHIERTALILIIAVALVMPLFASEYWLKGILIPTLIFGLATLGLNFVSGYAGLISLGQAAFMGVGAFAGVIAYGRYGIPIPLSLFIAGSVAAAIGAIVGTPSLRIKGLYLLVATLAAPADLGSSRRSDPAGFPDRTSVVVAVVAALNHA